MESIFKWAKRAKCRNEGILQEKLSKKYCTDCPVIGLCSTYAIVHNEEGIWGGMSEKDRKCLSPDFVSILTNQYQKEGLLENRSIDPLESLMHLAVPQLAHIYPSVQTDPYQDSTLSQSA